MGCDGRGLLGRSVPGRTPALSSSPPTEPPLLLLLTRDFPGTSSQLGWREGAGCPLLSGHWPASHPRDSVGSVGVSSGHTRGLSVQGLRGPADLGKRPRVLGGVTTWRPLNDTAERSGQLPRGNPSPGSASLGRRPRREPGVPRGKKQQEQKSEVFKSLAVSQVGLFQLSGTESPIYTALPTGLVC